MKRLGGKIFKFIFWQLLLWLCLITHVQAAGLMLNSSSKSYKTGQIITVNLILSSTDQPANALALKISYDPKKLKFQSVLTNDSAINFWAEKPVMKDAKISLQGLIYNPGYKGKSAKIVTIKFKAIAPGLTSINIGDFQVLANDGKGTTLKTKVSNLPLNITGAIIADTTQVKESIAKPEALPKIPESITSSTTLAGLIIKSSTHPLQKAWYRGKLAKLTWSLPPATQTVSYSVDKKPMSDPGNNERGKVLAVSYQNLTEGSWYFHIKIRTKDGWSAPAHYRLNFDNQGPKLSVSVDQSTANQAPKVYYSANDSASGIDHYEVKINNGSFKRLPNAGTFVLNIPASGRAHKLVVSVYDKAGNKSQVTRNFIY